jgi:tricarballylate dehydrogenase
MSMEAGAAPRGHWSGCHAIAWDADAPNFGDPSVTNRFSRQAYPFGIVVNQEGQRFLDEGADFRNYTYAKYGAEILRQPGGRAFQLFDAESSRYISAIDYDTAASSKVVARTIDELAVALQVDPTRLSATISAFNRAAADTPFDPTIRDGKGTKDLVPPKSNWALPLAVPPFTAYKVTCGITFTFGGLSVDPDGSVLRVDALPVPGLFACGELLGGLFYHNYPGGSGLTAGTVFGRRAGTSAARTALAART